MTQATSWMPFEWVSRAARTYERQELFEARQRAVMDQLAGAGAIAGRAVLAGSPAVRRLIVEGDLRDEIAPKNIIMIGPTGVGKTEIARRLARLARAPGSEPRSSPASKARPSTTDRPIAPR